MKSIFQFLEQDFPDLFQIGNEAEICLHTNTNLSLLKLVLFGEAVLDCILKQSKITPSIQDEPYENRIILLRKNNLLPQDVDDILYYLRTARGNSILKTHENIETCEILLKMAHALGVWLIQVYSNNSMTSDKSPTTDIVPLNLSEKETRYHIDAQLKQVGWEADTLNLCYSKGTRPEKGRNIAIAEWVTDLKSGTEGRVDYALFVGLKLVAIVEAKKSFTDIPSVIDNQCKDYASHIKDDHKEYIIDTWGEYKAPFVFATNGRKYIKQLEIKSGIWFLDLRKRSNIPKALQGWMSPDGMLEILEHNIEQANKNLQETSPDFLTHGLELRSYQIRAIEAMENAVIDGKQVMLLAMATGTGKTRTILGMIYRFLKAKRFKRVLFLVDRSALGDQARDVFKDVKIEDLLTIDSIYNIKTLEDENKYIDKETKIHIATVQGLVKRLMYNDKIKPAVSDYDLIVIDEAHRGYTLDKEMGDDEFLYRDQEDFISKYRMVIDYFDAVKIALTATPALHTTEIFGHPIFNYSYREAVIDGYLVDYDAPHNIKTKLNTEGITHHKGEIVPIYNTTTGEITNSSELEDEITFEVNQFNRQVITESFNKTALQEIANHLNPDGEGKTLIYAVNDMHADLIVKILREIYELSGVDQDAVMKITGSIGDRKRISEAIRRFKNELFPNIVVTVDLLTTGIDVPEITNIVFMRCVRSRILFEQMLGRATRLCPKIKKECFHIYDAVRVYEFLEDVNTMKPIVANPSTTFDDLVKGFDILLEEDQIQNQVDLIIAKLQRKIRNMNSTQKEHFKDLTHFEEPKQFIEHIQKLPPKEAQTILLNNKELFDILDIKGAGIPRYHIISGKEDELLEHSRGYGNSKKPQDYLDEFKIFITENADKIEALKIVCTRPSDLTLEGLKSLKLLLDREGFTADLLNSAWKETKKQDVMADIIGFIRSQAINSKLIGYEERIHKAIDRLKQNHDFSAIQLGWLDHIESHLLKEIILNEEMFNSGIFRDKGGFKRLNKVFNDSLDSLIKELNEYLYDDKGEVA